MSASINDGICGRALPVALARPEDRVVTIGCEEAPAGGSRRPRAQAKRDRTVRLALTDAEYEAVSAAAAEAGLARGAYSARVVLAAARGTTSPADEVLRGVLRELIQAAGLVRRIGVNLNQSVAKLNATGQRSADLLPYARESLRRADHLDQVAELVRRRLQ